MFLLLLTFAKLANGNTTRTLRRLNHGGCTRTLVEAPFAKGTCFRRKTAQRSGRAERLHHRVEPVGFKWSCTRLSSTWSENRRAREMVHCGTKATSIPCRSRRGVRPSGGGGHELASARTNTPISIATDACNPTSLRERRKHDGSKDDRPSSTAKCQARLRTQFVLARVEKLFM
jgi:hypothetical protein